MSRMVYCVKLKKEAPGLARPPYPGEKGEWVFENVSMEAWNLWQQHQTRLINEKRLSLVSPEARQYLGEQMMLFFSGDEYERAEGYIPENK